MIEYVFGFKWLNAKTLRQISTSPLFAPTGICFHIGVAILLVLIRLCLWDYKTFFELNSLPLHDLNVSLAFFTTNMHSQRLTGELAWWNPVVNPGYPQYQQMFLSPLAPTPSHIVFILWSQLISALAVINKAIPEYYQYLLVNYVVLPFLTFWAFAAFVGNFLKTRAAVLWVCLTYTLSGIGLWQGAWFYFQESFSLWCVLAAFFGFINAPSRNRILLLLAAALIQAVSVNYWTVYNSWFYFIVVVSYAFLYFAKLKEAALYIRALSRQGKMILCSFVLGAIGITAMWWFMLGTIANEEDKTQIRVTIGKNHYEQSVAIDRKIELRRYTTELFNPTIDNARNYYRNIQAVHSARYIGMTVLPLLLILAVINWDSLIIWFIICAIALFEICLASPPLSDLWEITPGMNRIVHVFYFYTHYWQLMLTFLAASVLDIYLTKGPDQAKSKTKWINAILLVSVFVSLLVIIFTFILAHTRLKDSLIQGIICTAFFISAASFVFWKVVNEKTNWLKQFYVFLFLAVTLMDLVPYFGYVNKLEKGLTAYSAQGNRKFVVDHEMSFTEIKKDIRLDKELDLHSMQDILKSPWRRQPSISNFGDDIFENMPIYNYLWPINQYIEPKEVFDLKAQPKWLQKKVWQNKPIMFSETFPKFSSSSSNPFTAIPYSFKRALYNSFAIELNVPSFGWLLLRELPDKHWHYYIDGKAVESSPVNLVETALRVSGGHHLLEMDYQPFARQFYKWCCFLLELWLAICLLAIIYGLAERFFKRKAFS